MKTKSIALLGILLAFAGGTLSAADTRLADIPASLQVGEGFKLSFRAYAVGFQSYIATVSATDPTKLVWSFTGPQALLFDADGNVVGIHYAYAGPTRPGWESESGSLVVCARNVPPVTVDPTAIPWLLLDSVQSAGPGIFDGTSHIQRVNTTGGLPPATAPTKLGEEVRVPYTAEYYFYRAQT